jgi:superfamily I DNA and RNA helicase
MPNAKNVPYWSVRVNQAVRDARLPVVGREDVGNEAHADVLIGLLGAYGDSSTGFAYVEPYLAKKSVRPNDILICHPELGVLVVEVKGHAIGDIVKIAAGALFVRQGGFTRDKNAFKQAETAMFDIKSAVERKLGQNHRLPLFEFAVALPRISEAEWRAKGYSECLDRTRLLFADDLQNKKVLRQRLGTLVQNSLTCMNKKHALSTEHVNVVRSVFGDSAVVNVNRPLRDEVPEETTGGMVEDNESAEKNLSAEQQELSRLDVGGHPRVIRGVAGSGKTVVLANMVARYLSRNADQSSLLNEQRQLRIAVVCFNRALVSFIQARIRDAYGDRSEFPNGVLTVCHLNQLMWKLCEEEHLPIDYIRIRDQNDPVVRAATYRKQLNEFRTQQPEWFDATLFDAIFIDEGQDFVAEEYSLLLDLIRPNAETGEKPIIIFYDDAQNVYGRVRPTWADIGISVPGRRTRIMKECFRNSKQIVELAFNVLLGSQAPQAARATTRGFTELGDLKSANLVTELESRFRVHFADRSGPSPEILTFDHREVEFEWISSEINRLIGEQFVRPSDILVLFEHQHEMQQLADILRTKIPQEQMKGVIVVNSNSPDKDSYLFREGHLTIATTRSAKGYDSPIVIMCSVDKFSNNTAGRASFYVGATRAKYLLYLTGTKYGETLLTEAVLVRKMLAEHQFGDTSVRSEPVTA